jgi:hypothetical protein
MAQLATFRQEALPELEREHEAIAVRASTLAEYTDNAVFISERDEEGKEVPPSWFGLNPELGEDSLEEIASSDEGEEEEGEEDGNGIALDDGASSQSRPNPAPAGSQQATSPAAADQTATLQPEAPPASAPAAADSSVPPTAPPA